MAKAKSKEKEVKAKLPKNPNEFSYRGDEDLVIKAKDFLALVKVIELAISNGSSNEYPTRFKYVASATGIDVENPAEKEIKTGAVRSLMDVENTFSPENLTTSYDAWLVPDVINAKEIVFATHARNVELGNAVSQEVLMAERKAEHEARQAQAQKPRVEDEADTPVDDMPVDDMPVGDTPVNAEEVIVRSEGPSPKES